MINQLFKELTKTMLDEFRGFPSFNRQLDSLETTEMKASVEVWLRLNWPVGTSVKD